MENYQEEWVTRAEILELLQISTPTLNKLEKMGVINPSRVNRKIIRYNKNEVINYLKSKQK